MAPSDSESETELHNVPNDSPFSAGKALAYTTESSDDEESGSKPKRVKKGESEQPKMHMIRVVPSGLKAVSGIIVYMDGYADKVMSDQLYGRSERSKQKWVDKLKLVHRVVFPLDENGEKLQNERNYPFKGIALVIKADENTEENCKVWANSVLIPAIKGLEELREEQIPVLNPDIKVVKCWGKVLNEADWKYVITSYIHRFGDGKVNYNAFFQNSKDHLYSVFKRGEMTVKAIKNFKLKEKHLDNKDAAKITKKAD